MVILLDMDGVLANFDLGVAETFDLSSDTILTDWEKQIGLPESVIWNRIGQESEWFTRLEVYDWALDLFVQCNRVSDTKTYICTSPPRCIPDACAQKVRWLHHFTSPFYTEEKPFNQYVLTKHKYLLANPKTILIDDHEKNIRQFRKHGGIGILFPKKDQKLFLENYLYPALKILSSYGVEDMLNFLVKTS